MSLDRDTESWLKARATRVAREHTGLPEKNAAAIVETIFQGLYERFRGERLYFCPSRESRDQAVLADVEQLQHDHRGDMARVRAKICRRHGIGRSTFYRILQRRCGGE